MAKASEVIQKIEAFKCRQCDKIYLDKTVICHQCGSVNFGNEQVGARGTIYSYTIVRVPGERYKNSAPYLLAIIQLEEGIRLMARTEDNIDRLSIGMKVEIISLTNGVPIFKLR